VTKIWNWLDGKKTWIGLVLNVVLAELARRGVPVPDWTYAVGDLFLGVGVLHKAVKAGVTTTAAAMFVAAALVLPGCAGMTPSNASPSTAGAPATAGQIAQTVSGQQGQAPSTATGGTAAVNWYFASSVPSEVIGPILKMADAQKWTAEQVAAAIKSANGAPTTVTITTTGNSAAGGNASSIPAGTGGTAGVGGAGTVQKP
jgi:hypothetical protein